MSTSQPVKASHWYMGGGDRGIFVSRKTIQEELEKAGFDSVRVLDRTELGHMPTTGLPGSESDDAPTALPFPPSALPAGASDNWDTFVTARWAKGDGSVSLEVSPDRIAWVVDAGLVQVAGVPAGIPPATGLDFPKPATGGGGGTSGGGGSKPGVSVGKVVYGAVAVASTAVCVYHGTKRNDSVGWGLGWGLFGFLLGPIAVVAAFAQGLGEKKRAA